MEFLYHNSDVVSEFAVTTQTFCTALDHFYNKASRTGLCCRLKWFYGRHPEFIDPDSAIVPGVYMCFFYEVLLFYLFSSSSYNYFEFVFYVYAIKYKQIGNVDI